MRLDFHVCTRRTSTQAAYLRECLEKAPLWWATQVGSVFRGTFALDEPEFDWGAGYARPAIPPQDLVIYEMGVRSFTADASAGVPPEDAGTFRGLQAKARPWASCVVSLVYVFARTLGIR